jgi:Methyltransferase domain
MMSGALATSLWIGLSILNLILLAAIIVMLRRTRRAVKRTLRVDRLKNRRHFARQFARQFGRSIWPQVESLVSLYRILDGKADFPATRIMAVSPDFMLHIVRHIRLSAPNTIVECGGGTSTIVMAHMLKIFGHDAHIYVIENHEPSIEEIRQQLRQRDLERFVTLIVAPLIEKRYDGFKTVFNWYDLRSAAIPSDIDLLIVDGPFSLVNACARYPAGPELFPKLARDAHIFVDDANRADERRMIDLWQILYPDLAIRKLRAEKGCVELFLPAREAGNAFASAQS